jgi:hypothetical protein
MFAIDSPQNILFPESINNQINWTATYRHDSVIPVPYSNFYPYYEKDFKNKDQKMINYSAGKTKKIAWFVSNCRADNNRLEYGQELQKYIQVDIYGRFIFCSKIFNFCF